MFRQAGSMTKKVLLLVAVLLCPAYSEAISLGTAADYAVLGAGGTSTSVVSDFEVYQSATVVTGNVGMGPFSRLTHGIDATITGRFDYDLTSTLNGQSITGTIGGGVHQINLSSVVADARSASSAAAALAPTQTFTTLTEGQTIVGNGGLNVIRVTGDVTLKKTLTLQGGPSDVFVFQFTSATTAGHDILTLSGMVMSITSVLANNIFWDLNGAGGDVTITSGAIVFGNFLAPDRNLLSDHGIVTGRLIAGGSGSELSVHSGSQITIPNVPEPSTLVLLGAALISLVLSRTSRSHRSRAVPSTRA
jgi:hypothetical protein